MANINNSQLSKELVDGAKIQTSFDKIPSQLADKVVPVMEVNPRLLRKTRILGQARVNNSTAGTIFTSSANYDTYITNVVFSYIKDVTSTATQLQLRVTIDGVVLRLIEVAGITLTVANGSLVVNLDAPLKIDRNTAVTLNSDTNVANFQISASVIGYTTEQG